VAALLLNGDIAAGNAARQWLAADRCKHQRTEGRSLCHARPQILKKKYKQNSAVA